MEQWILNVTGMIFLHMWSYARVLLGKSKVGSHLQRQIKQTQQCLWAQICSQAQVFAQDEYNAFKQKSLKPWKIRCIHCQRSQSKPFCRSVCNRGMISCAKEQKQFLLSSVIFFLKHWLSLPSPGIHRPRSMKCKWLGQQKGIEGVQFLSMRSILEAMQQDCKKSIFSVPAWQTQEICVTNGWRQQGNKSLPLWYVWICKL